MKKVLVVDDEKSIRLTLSEFLKKEGYETDTAEDVDIASSMIKRNGYDVIVSDIIMPRISGIQILKIVREYSQGTQVIMMTGEPTIETATEAVRNGANDYVAKPVNKATLLKVVNKAMHIKSLQDEKIELERQNLLYQKKLEEMVEIRTNTLQKTMQSIIFLLSSIVEIVDPYTAGHQRRVGNLAAKIAEKMNYDQSVADNLRIIGYIHDIGKIGIPAEILSKPGRLTRLEIEMIHTHSTQGYEMLKKANLPPKFAEIIYQHHERLNGSGYPQALKNNELYDETQVLIVADVVEAMMSHRPYRPKLGLDKALEEIRNHAGDLYKNEVVNTCIELFIKDGYVLDEAEHEIYFPL